MLCWASISTLNAWHLRIMMIIWNFQIWAQIEFEFHQDRSTARSLVICIYFDLIVPIMVRIFDLREEILGTKNLIASQGNMSDGKLGVDRLSNTYFITDRIENWKPLAENIEIKFDSKCWIQNVLTRCLWISASAKINTSCCKYHNITYKISDSPLIILHNQQAAGIYLRMSQQNLYTWAKTRTRMNEQYFVVNKDFRCTFFFKIQSIYLMYHVFEYDHVKQNQLFCVKSGTTSKIPKDE